jgi:hypothetical protein
MCSNLAELPSCQFKMVSMGPWRSPVAHLHGMQGVRGSNPLGSTEVLNTDTRKALNHWFGAFLVATARESCEELCCRSSAVHRTVGPHG